MAQFPLREKAELKYATTIHMVLCAMISGIFWMLGLSVDSLDSMKVVSYSWTCDIVLSMYWVIRIIEYGSTLYVGMTRKKNGGPIKRVQNRMFRTLPWM